MIDFHRTRALYNDITYRYGRFWSMSGITGDHLSSLKKYIDELPFRLPFRELWMGYLELLSALSLFCFGILERESARALVRACLSANPAITASKQKTP